jgi:catalase
MTSAAARAMPSSPGPEDLIAALNAVFGRHAATRASHAKGFRAVGTFTPAAGIAASFASPVFASGALAADLRLSLGGGDPHASDKGRSVRGLAARIRLPDGSAHVLVTITAPTFFAATPEQLVAFFAARRPTQATGKPDPAAVKAFNDANLNIKPHLDFLAREPVPASYATARYFTTHAFRFATPGGAPVAARVALEPLAGVKGLSPEEEKALPGDFLQGELASRLAAGPVAWDVRLIVAKPGDKLDDPTVPWPLEERELITVGRLAMTSLVVGDEPPVVFDPSLLAAGIAPTNDPIFSARSAAYRVSFARRTGG